MDRRVCIIGAGLAGSEAALQLADRGVHVTLCEARPHLASPVHKTSLCAELVCSNSLKSEKLTSAAGLLKHELDTLGSYLYQIACETRIPAGGALAVDREQFASTVTARIEQHKCIEFLRAEALSIDDAKVCLNGQTKIGPFDAVIVATGPLTTEAFSDWLVGVCGAAHLAFFDAAAPIVDAESLDYSKVFKQSRYEDGEGDYLNAPLSQEEYELFIHELVGAKRVVAKDFETKDLFSACQPIEEIARKGKDAPRFGPLKPVGLVDPRTGRRPWAVLQLRAEDACGLSYNLVGFQTNLTFPEQERVFRLIPGLEQAEFVRYGVMHRNTFLDAPRLMKDSQEVPTFTAKCQVPVYLAGQIAGTEGYSEAIRAGLQAGLEVYLRLKGFEHIPLPRESVYGSLLAYATSPETVDYQPMHVNFGIIAPLEKKLTNKQDRYMAYAMRAHAALRTYKDKLVSLGVFHNAEQ